MIRPFAWLSRAADAVRAADWWDYKFGPILLLFYESAVLAGVPVAQLWPQLLALLCAVTVSAIYVSVINDWTDRMDDRAAGKRNRFDGRAHNLAIAALAGSLGIGAGFMWLWRDEPALLVCFAGPWVAFTLYSSAPIRLKARGGWGVIADAVGSNLFPGLLAIALVLSAVRIPHAGPWMIAAGCWIFALGVRGILWHQLADEAADRISRTGTFVQRHGRRRAIALATWIALPMEIGALAAFLFQVGMTIPLLALLAYAVFTTARSRLLGIGVTLIEPSPSAPLALQEYDDTILPIAILTWSAVEHHADVFVLTCHLALFWRRPRWIMQDCIAMLLGFRRGGIVI